MQTKKRLSMIQSPSGQINVTAPIGFPIETVETYMNPDQNITSSPTQNTHNTDSSDQLIWSNPIHTNLHPQILRQIAFSDNLLHMAQSAKTPIRSQPILGTRRNTPNRVETMVLHVENGGNGTRQY